MSERAALVERMAEAIEQQFDLGYTATAIDFATVALAAVEAVGGWPRPETIMPEEIDEIARWFTLPLNLTDDARNLVVREILAALPDRHRRLVLGVQGE